MKVTPPRKSYRTGMVGRRKIAEVGLGGFYPATSLGNTGMD